MYQSNQESIFNEFYKKHTNGKHAFIAQTIVCTAVDNERKKNKQAKEIYIFLLLDKKWRIDQGLQIFLSFHDCCLTKNDL